MCRLEGKERQARIACGTYIYSRKDGTTRQKEKKMTTTTRQNFRKRKVHIFSSVFSFFQRCSTSTRGHWATSQYYQSASLCPLAFRLADTDVTMLKNIETSMHRALPYRLHLTPQNKSYFVDHHLQRQYAAVQIHLSLSDKQMTSMLLVMIRRKPSSGIAFREKSNRPRCIQATQRKRRQLSSHEQTNANERWFPKDRYFVVDRIFDQSFACPGKQRNLQEINDRSSTTSWHSDREPMGTRTDVQPLFRSMIIAGSNLYRCSRQSWLNPSTDGVTPSCHSAKPTDKVTIGSVSPGRPRILVFIPAGVGTIQVAGLAELGAMIECFLIHQEYSSSNVTLSSFTRGPRFAASTS